MLTIAESRIQPEIVWVAYPVEETIQAILESAIPYFYADFLLEGAGFGTTLPRNGVGIPTGVTSTRRTPLSVGLQT
jgi:hypothetical protein